MMKQQQKGFTLIELMIVVLTLALLATIAYPSYETYIRRTRLENVRANLLLNAQKMERHYSQQHRFPSTVAAADLEQNTYFDISYEAASGDNFRLIARPNKNNNPNENRYMQINGDGIVSVCEQSTGEEANCYVYK
ncbi:type IV pilin protein [Neisseria montereyensis]|uniref:type IV pilin protein n=1 Tax=Neisseria montereyensis TaxID=2973938 RepID=UPI0025A44E29|nr:type IV pilin protein [Neisseria montereyensis]